MGNKLAQGQDEHRAKDALDGSNASTAERRVPQSAGGSASQEREADPAAGSRRLEQEFLNDPTRIAMGTRQLNAAAFAGNRPDPRTLSLQADEKRRKADEAYSREMQRLAEWNAKVVTIGGVQMTNAQAQEARRKFIENEDEYAERAVQRGLIRDGEQDELKRTMRRKCELEDRTGRGVATAAESRELADLNKSPMGRAVDTATANIHTGAGIAADAKATFTRESSVARSEALPTARDIFQSTPVAQKAFAQAASPTAVDSEPEAAPGAVPAPVAPSRQVRATGLDI